jgi:TRAP-type transport system periplasmic protein
MQQGRISIVSGFVAALAAVALMAPAQAADKYIMKFGTPTVNDPQVHFLGLYKAALEKASGGRIEVQVYPASQLGAIPVEIQGVQVGSIQGFMAPVDFFTGIDQRFSVFAAPMLFRDEANTAKTLHDPALEKELLAIPEAKGMVGIATMGVGASHYAAKHPILRLADFKGKKLRINGSSLEREKMSALGATGVAMALSEVMPALDQGVIDGTISGFAVFVPFKMWNLVKVVTVTNDTELCSIAVVSKRWLESLPPELRPLIAAEAHKLEGEVQAWQQVWIGQMQQKWIEAGGQVHQLPPEDMAKLKTLLEPVGDQVTKSEPAAHKMLEEVRKVAAKY